MLKTAKHTLKDSFKKNRSDTKTLFCPHNFLPVTLRFFSITSNPVPQDFSMEVEAMSLQKASVFKEGTKLNHQREADFTRLRAQLTQLDVSWSQLSSDLLTTQEQLQQVQIWYSPCAEELKKWNCKISG